MTYMPCKAAPARTPIDCRISFALFYVSCTKKGKAHAIVGLPYKSNCAESLHNLIVATVSLSNTRST